ncbi:MAG TPA: DNA mismatch repair protein MutS, partial [Rhodothermia bacterium]|nr:DNA mismatch repair protein MutS [Rhodothermia bacterium]
MSRASSTPLMQQYREIKARHQDAILFFRMGDFYEMFYEDAEVASRALGLTLTSRNNGGSAEVPLAGVPVKAAGEYLRRLVQQGFRVSICEQTEDPRFAKGIVRREVIETVTPGAAYADDMLDGSRNNFLCAIHSSGDSVGIAAVDVTTGELRLVMTSAGDADAALSRLTPREILVAREKTPAVLTQHSREEGALVTEREAWEFDAGLAAAELTQQFGVVSIEGLGITESDGPAVAAAGVLMRYLHELQPGGIPHLARPKVERPGGTMPLDEMTRRNLELVESLRGGDREGTLLGVLDRTLTPMGSRLLRQWLLAPLTDRKAIDARLDAVSLLATDPIVRERMRSALDGVRDVERLAGKTASARATPREVRALGDSIERLPAVEAVLKQLEERALSESGEGGNPLAALMGQWDACADLGTEITNTLVERPPLTLGDEPSVRAGVDAQLDEWRTLRDGGKDGIARIQMEERARTGINSLKVGYNRVFGYFIEVTNSNAHLVPADYQRRQTLTGAERYVTPALKEFEEKVLTAAERIEERERELFEALRRRIGTQVVRLQCVGRLIAELDVFSALAEVAEREGYVRPEMTDAFDLEIVAGRHPVVERMMQREKFIPNDVRLTDTARMIILTGPNMAGKSTILRQIGLIVLLAQIGSFVPASRARIGVVDRLFTRVGASDNLVRGQSTFMVEMSETSAILHTATKSSLVLLDEIGRGTSTYDGVSIAWSVSEHLHDKVGCKTVFATHYHELTQLTDELVAACNYSVQVREVEGRVLFLHRLVPGGADRSYGIEVGRLAGLPEEILQRARTLLALFEGAQIVTALGRTKDAPTSDGSRKRGATGGGEQLPLFGSAPHPIVEELKQMDPNEMKPIDALAILDRLVARAR